MKRLLKIVGALALVFVLLCFCIPFFVSTKTILSRIEKGVAPYIHGQLSIEDAHLNFRGRFVVALKGVSLQGLDHKEVLGVQQAELVLFWRSLFQGKIAAQLNLQQPSLKLVQDERGQWNLQSIFNSSQTVATTESEKASGAGATGPGTQSPVPARDLDLSVALKAAHIQINSKKSKDVSEIKNLDFSVDDFSLNSQQKIPFRARFLVHNENQAQGLRIDGPLEFHGTLQDPLGHLALHVEILADAMDIDKHGTFHKTAGTKAQALLDVHRQGETEADFLWNVATLKLHFMDFIMEASGTYSPKDRGLKFRFAVPRFEVKKLSPLVEASQKLKLLGGGISLQGQLAGTTTNPVYTCRLELQDVQLQTDSLRSPLTVDGSLALTESTLQNVGLKLHSSGLDSEILGHMSLGPSSQGEFSLKGKLLDLDALLKPSTAAPAKTSQIKLPQLGFSTAWAAADAGSAVHSSSVGGEDFNGLLAPLRANEALMKAKLGLSIELQDVKMKPYELNRVLSKIQWSQGNLSLQSFSARIYGGSIDLNGQLGVQPLKPSFSGHFKAQGLDSEKAAEQQSPMMKGAVQGLLSMDFQVQGVGLNPSDRDSWKGQGRVQWQKAKFKTLNIARQIQQGLLSKIPSALAGSLSLKDHVLDREGDYKTIDARLNLSDGRFGITDLKGVAEERKGFDFEGAGSLALKTYSMDLNVDFIDKYLMLGQQFPKDPHRGVPVLKAHIQGTLEAPQFDWGATLQGLVRNAAREQIQKQGAKLLDQHSDKLPGAAKDLLKGLFGR